MSLAPKSRQDTSPRAGDAGRLEVICDLIDSPPAEVDVMSPDAPAPLLTSDEVGVEVGDAQVVDDLNGPGVAQVLHCRPTPVRPQQFITDRQLPGCRPA